MRRIVSLNEPDCSATLRPRKRIWRASSTRPIAAANLGVLTTSERDPSYSGAPTRTGFKKMSSASSAMPGSRLDPPVITMPDEIASS